MNVGEIYDSINNRPLIKDAFGYKAGQKDL